MTLESPSGQPSRRLTYSLKSWCRVIFSLVMPPSIPLVTDFIFALYEDNNGIEKYNNTGEYEIGWKKVIDRTLIC